MFSLFCGGKIVSKMADELGVNRQIYKTALTEEGINFAFYKIDFRATEELFPDEQDRIAHLARHSINPAYRGLQKLEEKFPSQPQIAECMERLISYARGNKLLDE